MNMLPEDLPVVMMADFSAAGDQFGCRAFSSATMPATCGVAIDVPEPNAYSSSLAARMLTPGAAMSGCERNRDVVSWQHYGSDSRGIIRFYVWTP